MAAAALSLVNPLRDASAQTALPDRKIAAGPAVQEGKELTFTISASDPTLDRDLTVNVQVTEDTSQSRTYLNASERGSKRAILYAGMDTGTYTVKTLADNNDGAVTVTLRPGNGYTVGATNAATGTVTDKDDNIAEVEASATAILSLEETVANVTVDENRNTFLLRHSDDDNLNIRLIKRYDDKGTTETTDDTVSHAVYFTRPMDYAIEIFLKGKNGTDNRTLSMPSTSEDGATNLTMPHEYTIHGGVDQYSAIVVRTLGENYTFFDRQAIMVSDGIQLIDHDDDIPVIGPPLQPQSSEVSPQGEVHDALTMGTGGGNGGESLNDRVSAVSVSDVTADGFTLGWSAANGADSYRVRYWQDENAASVVPVAGTTYTVTGLDAETEYSAQILAVVNGSVSTNKSSSVITVTTAAAATPAPAAQACNLPSDAVSVAEVTGWRDALDTTKAAAGIKRWNRVLATLGVDTGEQPMSADLAQAVSNWLKNTRWDRTARTLDAIEQCDN